MGENYQDYVEPIEFTENGAVKVDIVKKEDGTSILNKVITINVIKVDTTMPIISLEGLLDEIMVGDSYALPTSYYVNDKLSGGSVKCIDEEKNVIEDTKTLGIGEHTITCTVTTGAGNNADVSKTIKVTEQRYKTGEPYELGGYKWHVISDDGINLTLLMDANQLGDNSNMAHCTNDTSSSTDCGVSNGKYQYSWDKSKIRKYLNGEILTSLESKITNEIVSTSICADPSRGDNKETYGGFLIKELDENGKTTKCTKKVYDKVRLISPSEYYNMTPYYSNPSSSYPNVGKYISRLSKTSDYQSWFSCSSAYCGNNFGRWWTMGTDNASYNDGIGVSKSVYISDDRGNDTMLAVVDNAIRPVITIVK